MAFENRSKASLSSSSSLSQVHFDAISPASELIQSTAEQLAAEPSELCTLDAQKRSSIFTVSNVNMSAASLTDVSNNSCPLTHQYHYIQYPAYYQHISPQTAMPQVSPPFACHCQCSCGAMPPQAHPTQQHMPAASARCHSHQSSVDSQMAVAVIVHHQAGSASGASGGGAGSEGSTKAQSEQSLLNHSYQALQVQTGDSLGDEKPLNVLTTSKLNGSCDCDLECSCKAEAPRKNKRSSVVVDAMLGADEITVSESDNNSTMIKKRKNRDGLNINKKLNSWCSHDPAKVSDKNCDPNYNSSHIDIYSDGDGEETTDSCLKGNNGVASDGDDHRPPLPPRPPPRPRYISTSTNAAAHRHGPGLKKYVIWCFVCGGFSCILGILFLCVYFLLHSYTITVGNFETVPTFVPATLLILTGVCIMSLARRRNRYSYLMKLSGGCGLLSALICALVTITTTVLHMSRLQSLRECEYAQKTRTCTCYSDMIESQVDRVDKEGVRLVFDSLSDCGVVHGSLYSCLRAIFGLSVAGVLVAVFCCMLVYQLLSHERKKMYWEQLELRCRSLYTSQQGPPPNMSAGGGGGGGGGGGNRGGGCRCCDQCHTHRQLQLQTAAAYPWDDGGETRFWTGQPPGNFYSPNPGGDDFHLGSGTVCRGHTAPNTRTRATGWSWPRMPWQRNSPDPNSRFRQTPSSPDSQYGFSNNTPAADNVIEESTATVHGAQSFNVVASSLPYGVWGPPPPYSDPNSPARRGYYQYIQPTPCINSSAQTDNSTNTNPNDQHMPCLNHRSVFLDQPTPVSCCTQTSNVRNTAKRQATGGGSANVFKLKDTYENTPSDSDGGARDRFSNTLPTRKVKKRVETGAKSIGPNSQSSQRVNVQQVFPNATCVSENDSSAHIQEYREALTSGLSDPASAAASAAAIATSIRISCKQAVRLKRGVENTAFQSNTECNAVAAKEIHETCDPTESEVYFADVSSCCNMSVKNDNYYEDTNQSNNIQNATSQHPHSHSHAHQHQHQHQHPHQHPHPHPHPHQHPHPHPHPHAHQHQHEHTHTHNHKNKSSSCSSHSSNNNNEDYLAQRFGQRENSIRSRLPFPQSHSDDYEENLNIPTAKSTAAAASVNHMKKDISRQSMCSVESEAKTEFTDLSPATPCSNKFSQTHFANNTTTNNTITNNTTPTGSNKSTGGDLSEIVTRPTPALNFVASFPYSSESQSLEAHRRSTKNIHELMLAPDTHYEVINDVASPFSISPNNRARKLNQRPTNLITSKRNEFIAHKPKQTAKTRERLDTSTVLFPQEREWSEGDGDRQRL